MEQVANPPHFRRNVIALLIDGGCFGAGISFIQPATVIPALAQQLTNSPVWVGLVLTVWSGAWLLPQLVAGQWLARHPRKKIFLLLAAAVGRPSLLIMAGALASGLSPAILLLLLFLICGVFRGTDALAAVAWFDVMSGAIPSRRRGRVLGAVQVVIGILGFMAAMFLRWWLGPQGMIFPYNYAVLFGIAFVCMAASWGGLQLLVELPGEVAASDPRGLNLWQQAYQVIRHNAAFRMVTGARLLSGLAALAWPFYVSHATQILGLPNSIIGSFVATQSIACVLTSIVAGWISERYGSVRVIHVSAMAACISPLLALLLHLVGGPAWLHTGGYLLVYGFLSIVDYTFLLGYLNYVLDIAPPGQRPTFMGLTNTLGGLLIMLPTLGGWVLENTSYPVLFGITLAGTLAGLVAAWRLPSDQVA